MIRAACVGLGVIGLEIARTALERENLELVAAVDVSPDLAGRDLYELLGRDGDALPVTLSLEDALLASAPDIVILSTSSRLSAIIPQVTACLDAGASVVSTCEELCFPWQRAGAAELQARALGASRAVLSVGINPGYVMDLVPSLLCLPCTRIDGIIVERSVDLNRRRPALRAKAGVGLTAQEFERLALNKAIGHVGLDCSAMLLASAVGLRPDNWPMVEMEPVLDSDGTVLGFRQSVAVQPVNGSARLELRLEMSMRLEKDESDRILIEGEPSVDARFEGGILGDPATAGLVVNAIPMVLAAPPGVHTILDLPPLRAWKPPPP